MVLLRASGDSPAAASPGRTLPARQADAQRRRTHGGRALGAGPAAAQSVHASAGLSVHQGDVRRRRPRRNRHRLRRRGVAGDTVRPRHASRNPAVRRGWPAAVGGDSRRHPRRRTGHHAQRGPGLRVHPRRKGGRSGAARCRPDRRHQQYDRDQPRDAVRTLGRVNRRTFLVGLGGLTAAIARRSSDAGVQTRVRQAPPAFMYVGSYTSPARGHGEGITVYHRTGEADRWSLIQVVKDLDDPSFLTVDRPRRCLYCAHGDADEASAYRIDPATGRLTMINRQATRGANGVHLSIDGSGRFLALANYATGTLVVLPINPDGSLAPVSDLATMTGTPGPHRTEQTMSHPHHCPFDPTGRFIVVPDKGFDRVFVYRLDASSGTLLPGDPPSVAARAGAAPRHVDFHPLKPFAYVINELDSTITTYVFDRDKGALKPLQILPTVPPTYTGNNTDAEVWVSPSGRFVYGSNRGHDSIAIFAIDEQTGMLSVVGWEPTQGRTPRYFGLDPSGTHLYAANQNTDTVVVFRVNQTTGKLTATGETIKVGSPSTIAFR